MSAHVTTSQTVLAKDQPPRSSVAVALEAIDWSFAVRGSGSEVDSLHPYPAKFVSELPGTLLDVLSLPQDTLVFDPFCGSGTTLIAAQRRGLRSVGVDLNPVACLISRVKTSPMPLGLMEVAQEVVSEALANNNPQIPDIPNLDHWFKPDIQKAAAALVIAIGQRSDNPSFDALRLALSSILVRVSNQDSDTRYAAVVKNVSASDVFRFFIAATKKIARALSSRDWTLPHTKVIERDVLALTSKEIGGRVGAVITSPPYPNAYEYWLYHKYRMWWLGFDPLAVKSAEIGARAHFFKRDPHTADNFRQQMRSVFTLLNTVVDSGGQMCFVVGRSKIHGAIVDNADIVREIGEEIGLTLEARVERVIAAHRKSFNLSHANIKTESIVVLRKP